MADSDIEEDYEIELQEKESLISSRFAGFASILQKPDRFPNFILHLTHDSKTPLGVLDRCSFRLFFFLQ